MSAIAMKMAVILSLHSTHAANKDTADEQLFALAAQAIAEGM